MHLNYLKQLEEAFSLLLAAKYVKDIVRTNVITKN